MQIREQLQRNEVADEESALTAVVRPILLGILFSLKADVVAEVGGYENVKLKMLPRLRRPGDGDTESVSSTQRTTQCGVANRRFLNASQMR